MLTKTMIRHTISLILMLCLLPLSGLASSGGSADSMKIVYEQALKMLWSGNLADTDMLESVRALFAQTGFYQFSAHYLMFIDALLIILDDNPSSYDDAINKIELISGHKGFQAEYQSITDSSEGQVLPNLEDLIKYIEGRKLEGSDDQGAIALYKEYPVLDALTRADSLTSKFKKSQYDEAVSLMSQGTATSCKKAAGIFENLGAYKDSKQRLELCRQKIEELVTPVPTEKSTSTQVLKGTIIIRYIDAVTGLDVASPQQQAGIQPGQYSIPAAPTDLLANYVPAGLGEQTLIVDANGVANPADIIFAYTYVAPVTEVPVTEAPIPDATINIYYRDPEGWEVAPMQQRILPAGSHVIAPNPANLSADYNSVVVQPVTVTVDQHGASHAEIVFVYDKQITVGSTIYFGAYEQDNDLSNGKEAIAWRVLAVENGNALLISVQNLDAQPYNEEYTGVTWETCNLRGWLNGNFLNTAFTSSQQKAIVKTTLNNDKNSNYGAKGGETTQDRVFLLSETEAENHFKEIVDRVAKNTDYAKAHSAYTDSNGLGWWWLRSPGRYDNFATCVYIDGLVYRHGLDVSFFGAVRPALWLDLSSY